MWKKKMISQKRVERDGKVRMVVMGEVAGSHKRVGTEVEGTGTRGLLTEDWGASLTW